MKTNLLILVDILPDIKGGAERQIYEFLKHHDRNFFDITIVVVHQKTLPDEITDLPVHCRCLNIKRIYDLDGIIKGFEFKKLLIKKKTDILMTYHFAADIWGTMFGKMAKVPLIISNRRDVGFWRNKIHILAYKFVNRWVNKIIVVSEAVKKAVMREEKVKPNKVEVFYNGVDLTRFNKNFDIKAKKRELNIHPDAKIIGAVGNLRQIKGHKFMLEAAVEVVKKLPDTHFIFVGDGELKESFQKYALKFGIEENIHFLGKRKDIPELLAVMNVCVLPSLSEGLSNTLLEYMAAGKPIIATSVGGNPEVITDKFNGVLVEKANSEILAKKFFKFLENASFALELAIEAKNTVIEKFDLEKQLKKVEDFLLEEIKSKKEIRVLHLISSNGLFGAEKVLLNLAAIQTPGVCKGYVCAIKNTYNPHLEVIEEAKNLEIENFVVKSRKQFDFKTVKELVKIINDNKINLVHSHNFKANFIGMLAARKAKVGILATNHLWTKADFKIRVYEFIDAIILGLFFKKIIAVSNSIRKDMVRQGIANKKIEVIFNGINLQKKKIIDTKINEKFKITKNNIVLGVVARLSPEKGHEFLIEAVSKLITKHPEIKVLFLGNGPIERKLKLQVIQTNLLEKIIFAGFQKNVEDFYSIIDIIVQPSLKEGVPITLLEAMGHAKAIVATDVGGVGDLIKNNKTGVLIESGNSEELARAIEKLIENKELRERLGQQAQDYVKTHCTLEQMTSKYLQVYKEVLKS